MAAWQFQIRLLPQAVAATEGLFPGGELAEAQRESIAWWDKSILGSDALKRLREVLPPGKTWSKELEVFGDLETTCVTILREEGRPIEVSARLDLRSLSQETMDAVLDFAQRLNCFLVTDGNTILKPAAAGLAIEIEMSPAYRFVKDPRGFLSDLAAGSE